MDTSNGGTLRSTNSTHGPESRLPDNPFIRYRQRLDSYRRAIEHGWSDQRFAQLVNQIDEAIASVDGHGFETTPVTAYGQLHPGDDQVWVKDDTNIVGGSHKARHLFGVALAEAVDGTGTGELAIASCGNAAIAASVIALAIGRPLRVFIPTWADQAIVDILRTNRAQIEICPRHPDEEGDPTYLRFMEAISTGSTPFSVQSTATPTTLDGGRTMGWELADQLVEAGVTGELGLFVQVGGGALAAATWQGLSEGLGHHSNIRPVLFAVQTQACAPLARAWEQLINEIGPDPAARLAAASANPDIYMRPWGPIGPSEATGILDDETYDWLPILAGMLESNGEPIVVDETTVVAANQRARAITHIDVEPTGTAGYAGLLATRRPGQAAVLFTGVTRF